MVRKIAVTGGMGSGKSSFVKALANSGYVILDADQLSRKVMAQIQVIAAIKSAFANHPLETNGVLDRVALRKIVFADETSRLKLEYIVHPAIAAEFSRQVEILESVCPSSWIFYEATLIFEAKREREFDAIITVVATEAIRLDRLIPSRGLAKNEIERIMAAQMPQEEKASRSDLVIDNSHSINELNQAATSAVSFLRSKFADQ